jgi:hypothetical protein
MLWETFLRPLKLDTVSESGEKKSDGSFVVHNVPAGPFRLYVDTPLLSRLALPKSEVDPQRLVKLTEGELTDHKTVNLGELLVKAPK